MDTKLRRCGSDIVKQTIEKMGMESREGSGWNH